MSHADSRIFAVAGFHEPLAFWRRRGGGHVDDEAVHDSYFSQKNVENLAALNATTVVCPGYKGLGLQHERVEWDRLKPFGQLLERAGIELGAYLQCGSYYAETFYDEHPAAHEWTAIDYWGKPHTYSPAYRCYWRHRPCLTHRAFSEYTARVAATLASEYGVTYFNADNNAQMPCYTEHFRKAFVQFLRDKYHTETPAGLATFKRRYGHTNVDRIVLPSGATHYPIEALHTLPDPGLQDWVEFRCRLVGENCRIIAEGVRKVNPNAVMNFNIAYDYGQFHQLVWGTEPEFVAPHSDLVFSEDANQARVMPDGRLISNVHTCKYQRALGPRGCFHAPHLGPDQASRDRLQLYLMEMAVHNRGVLGYIYSYDFDVRKDDPRPRTIGFVRQHEQTFTNNTAVADIAVLRSRHSGTINWAEATEGRLLAQQALFQAGLQWDNITEDTLDRLSSYKLLILPETISVPSHCVHQIAEYVRQGGRVLAVGSALSCDEWGNRRSKSAVTALFGESDADFGSVKAGSYETAILAAWLGVNESCVDRLTAFPRLIHPKPFRWDPLEVKGPVINFEHHALPLNGEGFITTVRSALQAPPIVEVIGGGSPYVIPTLLRSDRDRRLTVHVINYRPEKPVETLTLRVNHPNIRAGEAKLINLDSKAQSVAVRREDQSAVVVLPPFRLYCGVLF